VSRLSRPTDRVRRVHREDLAHDEPVEQHADGSQVHLHGRLSGRRLQHLYIGGDVDRLDVGEPADLVLSTQAKKWQAAR
jgi:hypothetical protein